MSNEKNISFPPWLEPLTNEIEATNFPAVKQRELDEIGRRVLCDPLTAQRIVTVSKNGIELNGIDDNKDLILSNWGHTLPSAVAVLMPPPLSISDLSDKRARRKYQEKLLKSQSKWPDLATLSDTAFLLCADHKPPEYGLPNQLYRGNNSGSLISWDDVPYLIEQLTKIVSHKVAPAWLQAKPALKEALATIIYESFKNTHDHARENIDGSDPQTSVRAVYARYYEMSDVLKNIGSDDTKKITPVERYVRGFTPRDAKPGVRFPEQMSIDGFLELSVLDSGPGMAAKWLKRSVEDISPKEQLTAILHCFGKGRSTTGAPGRGFGLWKVLLSLRALHGFISVRTNSIHAYRQFGYLQNTGLEEVGGGSKAPKEQLWDWKRELSPEPSKYPHVKGTVVSFLLPMGKV